MKTEAEKTDCFLEFFSFLFFFNIQTLLFNQNPQSLSEFR